MNKYNKEILEQLILVDKKSYVEIGKLYNVSGAAIKKAAFRLGINLTVRRKTNINEHSNRKVQGYGVCENCGAEFIKYPQKTNKFCSTKCFREFSHHEKYQKLLNGDEEILRANYNCGIFKIDILKEQNYKCAICDSANQWNDKELIFVLDHIDGNAANNNRNNLRLVCPNCDSQLDTYKSKNRNSARKARYLRKT